MVDGTQVPGFDPTDDSGTHYTIPDYGYTKDKVNITYVKGDDDETVTGAGNNISVDVGSSSKKITVTAQNGTDKTEYYIDFYRKSNDATLSALNASAATGVGNINFDPGTTSYTYAVGADETSVDVTYTTAHAGATVVTTPANLTGINPRTTESVSIEVTPEDTTQPKKTYTITFSVAKSTNADLSNLTIN